LESYFVLHSKCVRLQCREEHVIALFGRILLPLGSVWQQYSPEREVSNCYQWH
jgi:hypothetical protein